MGKSDFSNLGKEEKHLRKIGVDLLMTGLCDYTESLNPEVGASGACRERVG